MCQVPCPSEWNTRGAQQHQLCFRDKFASRWMCQLSRSRLVTAPKNTSMPSHSRSFQVKWWPQCPSSFSACICNVGRVYPPTLKMAALYSFETLENINVTIQNHIPEDSATTARTSYLSGIYIRYNLTVYLAKSSAWHLIVFTCISCSMCMET